MSLIIVGSMAYDTIATPFERRERVLGGACTYASLAACKFSKPGIVGVIGDDFQEKHLKMLENRGVDITGVKREKGKSFFWEGVYHLDKGILKQILGQLFILNNHKNISKNAVLVTADEFFKGGFLTGKILTD